VADLHFLASDRFSVDQMLTKITELPRDDRWSALARAALRQDLYAALSTITSAVLGATDENLTAHERLEQWEKANAERVARARATVTEALARDTVDLATLCVALGVMRGLPT
jgi:glutamate dehydrogenase